MSNLSISKKLTDQETIIDRGLKTFVEVGTALARIREEKLWMAGGQYKNFEAYCESRWNWKARYVQQVCKSAQVAARIGEGEKAHHGAPANERQAREIAKLPESEQAEAWSEANAEAEAEGKPVTASKVGEVVARRMKPAEADEWEPVGDENESNSAGDRTPPNLESVGGNAPVAGSDSSPGVGEAPDETTVDPDSLEAVQADIDQLIAATRALAREVGKKLGQEKQEFHRPYCNRYTIAGLNKPLASVARYLGDWKPVGGTGEKPKVQREIDVARASAGGDD